MSEADEQALAERIVNAMLARDAFSQWLGVELLDVRPRSAAIRMIVRDEMVNGFGTCHGGITFSLADTALAFACNTHGHVTVSIENTITYPKQIVVGDVLLAVANEETGTNRLAFYNVTVRRDDELVASFRGTVYKTNQAFFPDTE